MKYIIHAELDPATAQEVEAQPEKIQEMIGNWQKLNMIGMYFGIARRSVTVIVDAPNEDALFEPLYYMWNLINDYPEVMPVADLEEFPAILKRAGVG